MEEPGEGGLVAENGTEAYRKVPKYVFALAHFI